MKIPIIESKTKHYIKHFIEVQESRMQSIFDENRKRMLLIKDAIFDPNNKMNTDKKP